MQTALIEGRFWTILKLTPKSALLFLTIMHYKAILSQNEVFKGMLVDNEMLEKSSGEVKITDVSAAAMESLLYFFYHDDFPENKITVDLLSAADKYIVSELIEICLHHLKANLTQGNLLNGIDNKTVRR